MSHIPDEIAALVCTFLPFHGLVILELVSKSWQLAAQHGYQTIFTQLATRNPHLRNGREKLTTFHNQLYEQKFGKIENGIEKQEYANPFYMPKNVKQACCLLYGKSQTLALPIGMEDKIISVASHFFLCAMLVPLQVRVFDVSSSMECIDCINVANDAKQVYLTGMANGKNVQQSHKLLVTREHVVDEYHVLKDVTSHSIVLAKQYNIESVAHVHCCDNVIVMANTHHIVIVIDGEYSCSIGPVKHSHTLQHVHVDFEFQDANQPPHVCLTRNLYFADRSAYSLQFISTKSIQIGELHMFHVECQNTSLSVTPLFTSAFSIARFGSVVCSSLSHSGYYLHAPYWGIIDGFYFALEPIDTISRNMKFKGVPYSYCKSAALEETVLLWFQSSKCIVRPCDSEWQLHTFDTKEHIQWIHVTNLGVPLIVMQTQVQVNNNST